MTWDQSTRIEDWQTITPDRHNDWINQRDATWESLLPLGHKDTKDEQDPGAPDTVMRLYSGGVKTNRDPYIYSYDDIALADLCRENDRDSTRNDAWPCRREQ